MNDPEGTTIGPWRFSRFRLVLAVAAMVVLAVECGLLIRDVYAARPWQQIWPIALSALALVVVLVQTLRMARAAGAEKTRPSP